MKSRANKEMRADAHEAIDVDELILHEGDKVVDDRDVVLLYSPLESVDGGGELEPRVGGEGLDEGLKNARVLQLGERFEGGRASLAVGRAGSENVLEDGPALDEERNRRPEVVVGEELMVLEDVIEEGDDVVEAKAAGEHGVEEILLEENRGLEGGLVLGRGEELIDLLVVSHVRPKGDTMLDHLVVVQILEV